MTIEAIERRIRDAIAKVQAEGWTLAPFYASDHVERTCCAVGALGVDCFPRRINWGFDDIETLLGIDEIVLASISEGFDGKEIESYNGGVIEAYELGAKFRAEFLGIS